MASLDRDIAQLLGQIDALQSTVEGRESPYRTDPVALFEAGGRTAYDWQRQALTTSARRVILNVGRQCGKSETASAKVLFCALFTAGFEALLIAPAGRQSGTLFLRVLELFRAAGAPMATTKLASDEMRFVNGSRIVALPGNGDTIRGFSPDLVVIDEASRVSDSLYHAIRPMLAATGGSLWAVSTPAGRRGWFYNEWVRGSNYTGANPEGWLKIRVPADTVPHIAPEIIEADRASLGDLLVRQEYLCEFIDGVASLFRPEDIERFFSGTDIPPLFDVDLPDWTDPRIDLLAA